MPREEASAAKPKQRGGSRPSTAVLLTLKPLGDRAIRELFSQACVGNTPAEPWLDCMRRMVRLVEAELQGQVTSAAHSRACKWVERKKRHDRPERLMTADERSEAQRVGQQARRQREREAL